MHSSGPNLFYPSKEHDFDDGDDNDNYGGYDDDHDGDDDGDDDDDEEDGDEDKPFHQSHMLITRALPVYSYSVRYGFLTECCVT